ncbi:competence protein CoiA [Ornithinibacillus xuwenensis]|uniref:Competence protein CoiA family protein n=1 Tax=Ornithinibacillus xuwenensis TaxID=3144668 RepID=A0ABU9XH71_9BACI
MLQAKLNTGELITLFQLSSEEIEKLRFKARFFCPTCHNQVIIKAGRSVTPHFAHSIMSGCPSGDGGEGVYHEKGKYLLFHWLQRQNVNASLEEYIPEINQRPDLLLRINEKKVAIEFQCARISIQEIMKRTEGYVKVGIVPIWILGANHFKRKGTNLVQLDQFTLHFIHQFTPELPLVIYFYDPASSLFITATDIIQTTNSQAIAKLSFRKLEDMNFLGMFKGMFLSSTMIVDEWKKAKQKFRMYQPRRLYGKELAWHRWLYLKGTHREYLPSVIYLPVSSQYLLNTSPWDWQSRICLELITPRSTGEIISLQACQRLLKNSITTESLPLIQPSKDPIMEYLQLLCNLQFMTQVSAEAFVKTHDFCHYSHIEEALIGDTKLMDVLLQKFSSKLRA